MTIFTPRSILSGRVKARHGRDLDTAIAAASVVLGTPQLACISSRVGDNIWYLCAPAVDLASHTQSSSPLAAALPGAPGHQGDGAYTLDLAEGLQAVLVKQKNSLSSFVGSPIMVQRFITLEGLKESFSCPGDGLPWRFAHDAVVRRDGRLQNIITLSALLVTVVASGTWLWAAYQRPSQETLRAQLQRDHKAALATAARAMTPPAYPPALEHLNMAVSQTIKSGGALVEFEHNNGRSNWSLDIDNNIVTETAGAGTPP